MLTSIFRSVHTGRARAGIRAIYLFVRMFICLFVCLLHETVQYKQTKSGMAQNAVRKHRRGTPWFPGTPENNRGV